MIASILVASILVAEPQLVVKSAGEEQRYTRAELLAHPAITSIEVGELYLGGKRLSYRAIPLAVLMPGVAPESMVQFKCLDGFSSTIPAGRLLASGAQHSMAYLAVEPAEAPWQALPNGTSRGPFYLVWAHPERSAISPEEWPYQLASFEVVDSLRGLYPAIFPDEKLKEGSAVKRGMGVFLKNCFARHPLNRSGASGIGPDLNVPMSPTEYLTRSALRRLIRNNQAVRDWPKARMSAFPASVLPEAELDALVAYLEHMARRKVR